MGIPEVDHAGNPIRYKSPAKVLEMKQWVEAENERIGGHAVEEMRWLEDVMREEDAKTVVAVSAEGAVEGETLGAGKTPGETGAARTSGGATPGAGGATLPAGTAARQAWMIFDANRFTARFQSEFWWDFRFERPWIHEHINASLLVRATIILFSLLTLVFRYQFELPHFFSISLGDSDRGCTRLPSRCGASTALEESSFSS